MAATGTLALALGRVLALVGLAVASGCNDLERFETEADEAYCGKIVAADFVRQGFADDLGLRLTLDIARLETRPGILSSGDSASGPCEPAPLFDEAPLRAIEKLLSDPLSTFDFGSGRVHNFFAWVDSTCSGPMLSVVSLLSNGTVEVRLLSPGILTAEDEDQSGFRALPPRTWPVGRLCALNSMHVLGIETSCDETAASVVDENGIVLSDVVHSQVELHAPYGGVVPELASRDHLANLRPVLDSALERAHLGLRDIDGIAVTCRPGLTGALLVGVQMAQGIAWALGKPVVGVDHLMGHLAAVYLQHPSPAPEIVRAPLPHVALLASGGHTALYRVARLDVAGIRELGATRDDAAGEAFDKVAKLLGLGYPGGPLIDWLAQEGDASAIDSARPMKHRDSLEFSFSGLKTDVARWVERHGRPANDTTLRNLCAAFQQRVVDTLLGKAFEALRQSSLSTLVLGGGVAANHQLREEAKRIAQTRGVQVVIPPLKSCTDNAAMIALAGVQRLLAGEDDSGRLEVSPHTVLTRVTRKGPGRRVR